ncbi:MAG: GatB/YqeY domain-containing protein [Bacteroidetes bacterium]|nr:GatB/YqeY domain-containing protein [Bacteroidota bacterium]
MNLEKMISEDMKAAMLAKDNAKLEAIRAIKAALLIEKTGKETARGELSEEAGIKLLQKLVKQRKEAAEIYLSNNRKDLADVELFQASVIEKYLPAQMGEEELRNYIRDVMVKVGASSIKDMGKVMGIASKELAGKADNKTISLFVKEILERNQ